MVIIALSTKELRRFKRPVLTVGTFDGVHQAHRAILKEVVQRARKLGGTSLVVTFEPHPQLILDPQTAPPLLTTQEEKLEILSHLGLEVAILVPFTVELAQMEATEFVKRVLHQNLGVWEMVIGHDHAFGHGRRGRLKMLRELGFHLGFKVDALEPILHRGAPISSTRIRRELLAGQVKEAAEMLGRPYNLAGQIISGEGRGKILNYPTANMEVQPRKLIPADGVYAVASTFDDLRLRGLLNVGLRPTFGGGARTVEIHFFDFQQSLYGEEINVQLIEKIRDEERFEDSAQLSEQIRKDEEAARRLLASET
jgi:riboflavin kinase/FMN adenylyltransferase